MGAREVEGHPFLMFLAGTIYSTISTIFALILNPAASSAMAVGLTALASMPLLLKVLEFETKLLELYPKNIVGREKKIVMLYLWFFLGLVVGYTLVYSLLPEDDFIRITTFQRGDLAVVSQVRMKISGKFVQPDAFSLILSHNLLVFSLGVLLSFIYGSGGAFLLSWNASILATLLSISIREGGGIIAAIMRFLSIVPHGILEFSAYFIGAFLGGLISLGLLHEWRKDLLIDCGVLFVTGLLLLILGAAVESAFV